MVVKRTNNYLSHHGIKGQSWGDQNGPPYPLDSQVSSAVKKKKSKSFIQKLKDKKKGKKLQAARKAKAEEKKKKEEIINSGDEKKIKKIQNTLTDEEYVRALNRISLNRKLKEVDYSNVEKKLQTIGVFANTVSSVGNAANSVLGAVDKAVSIKDKLKFDDNKSLKDEKERLTLTKDIKTLRNEIDFSDALKDLKLDKEKSSIMLDIAKNQASTDYSKEQRQYAKTAASADATKDILNIVSAKAQISGIYADEGEAYLKKLWNVKEQDKNKN